MSLLRNLNPESIKTFAVSLEYPESVAITDFKDVGSHSWTEVDGDPVLVIPGAPPRWTNPAPPIRVQPDQGVRFVDHTGAQCDKLGVNRLAPLFQSVDYCTPEFDYKNLDIVCNRNNLRNLLHWIEYSTKKNFRIDLHLVNEGKTLVMLEHEIATTEVVPASEFRGYGDNFRRRTVLSEPGQTRHNRIVTYKLGKFRLLMGHKVEAAFRDADSSGDVDSLLDSFTHVSVGRTPAARMTQPTTPGTLAAREGEDSYKLYKFVEIKTMSQRKEIDWKDFFPQLYLSQTAHLFVARHYRGTFETINKFDILSRDMRTHQAMMELLLGKFVVFLRQLMSTLRELEGGPWSLVCKDGTLRLYSSEDGPLPEFVLSRFNE